MPEVCAGQSLLRGSLAIDSVVAVGLVLMTLVTASAPLAAKPPALDASARAGVQDIGPSLTVDPRSFWMRTGENVSLRAVWSSGSPLCPVEPIWYRWTVAESGATGFLNTTNTSSATFTAYSFDSGVVSVTVRSGATVPCGANQTVVERSFSSLISVVVPLAVTGVRLADPLLLPGGNTSLMGNVSGGSLPYSLEVFWGDGTTTNLSLASPGPFEANHTFGPGVFAPYVVAVDSGGDLVNRSVAEAVAVGSGLEVTVLPESYVAEVGDPIDFLGVTWDPSPGSVALYDCANAVVAPVHSETPLPNTTEFSCTFDAPGVQEVLFGSYPPVPGGESASAVLYELVVAPPKIGVIPVDPVGEVGSDALLRVSLTGGALPIFVEWNLTGNRSSGSTVVDSDGGGVFALTLSAAGECPLGIQAVDALGGGSINDSVILEVASPLEVRAGGASSVASAGALAQVSGEVLAGLPPFVWWVVPEIPTTTGSDGNGSLDTVGGFAWSGLYAREGNLTISLGVADAAGFVWQTDLVVGLVPPLSAEFSVSAGPSTANGSFDLNLVVRGGWPPFLLFVNASDNESWNRTVPADGAFQYSLSALGTGTFLLMINLIDTLGGFAECRLSLTLPHVNGTQGTTAPTGPAGGVNASATQSTGNAYALAASFAVMVGTTAAGALFWRRHARRKAVARPGPNPEEELKRIIEPADGAERFTVELLAEEAGIPLSVVRTTIDRLVAEGRVHSESGADGEEVLSWTSDAR